MRVKDIMEPLIDYLSPDNTLKEAVNKMRVSRRSEKEIGVKGMIVLDQDKKLVGIVSIKDILRTMIPAYMSYTELGEFTWDGMLENMAKRVADKKVNEFMTKNVITVHEEDPLMECADVIVRHNLQRLPVVDKSKNVVGMVYVRDLYYAIVKTLLDTEA